MSSTRAHRFRQAGLDDLEALLALVRDFTATQDYPFDEPASRRALRELLGAPALGRAWLLDLDGAAVGYVVLAFGFSIEHAGRDAFIDEIYVQPLHRGHGLGRAAIVFALEQAAREGIRSVHLEVDPGNPAAERLYRSLGFTGHGRHLLTRRLVVAPDRAPSGEPI
jgi:ribosomal protein S18 acetylase RimI-like enzyme